MLPCVGRTQLQARLHTLLETARWVTLVGPPGSGKTLLARHAVEQRASHRTVWVSAQRLDSLEALYRGALEALDAEVAPGDATAMALKRAVDGTETLLVLDGVDGALDGLGAFLQEVVDSTTGVRILCTALATAGQPAEQVVRVGPLPVPRDREPLEGPAVELLISRVAGAGGHPLDLVAQGDSVRRVLRSSGGLPLLIEQLSVQIALVGLTDVVPTASLSQAVQASYDLLDDEQQRCFRRLSLMDGPTSLDVLADICGATRSEAAELAAALARRSLVEVQPDGRFTMLEPIRRHGAFVTASTDDSAELTHGLLRWAERVTPDDALSGAGDAPWLAEVPVMRTAIESACARSETRDRGYRLANAVFSSLYTAMRARDALDILEAVLASGDGPAEVGAQVARRAGIAASEVRGTYEGLRFLDRAEQHAAHAPHPDHERARTAAIRAEMHLDAGQLTSARTEAEKGAALGDQDVYGTRQARRTLVDVMVSRGDFEEAEHLARAVMAGAAPDELWMALSARTLMARIAFEQGRHLEAAAMARSARDQATAIAEDRVALLADTLHRLITGEPAAGPPVERESLPWAVRLVVQLQDARDLLAAGQVRQAAGAAADIVVLADSARLTRDGIDARLLLGDALLALGDPGQAHPAYLSALERAAECPLPLRAADALDGLAAVLEPQSPSGAQQLVAGARALRAPRRAVPITRPGLVRVEASRRPAPDGWVVDGQLTYAGVLAAAAMVSDEVEPVEASPLDALTRAERAVAKKVAEGLTSRQIAEELFVSPRTVDAHLAHIYRKLEIPSRARLAALMADYA